MQRREQGLPPLWRRGVGATAFGAVDAFAAIVGHNNNRRTFLAALIRV
jgi:hypothetical protein